MDMESVKKQIAQLVPKYHLSLVLLFGSQATGKTDKESDVDVAYLPEQTLDFSEDVRLNYEFTLIFRTDRVDTVNLRYAHALLLKQITDQGVVLYEKTGIEFHALQVYALRRFVEAEPLFKIRDEKLDAFLRAHKS